MYTLDNKWLEENFIEGDILNTKVGDTVYVSGYDGVDEVLFPHTVISFDEDLAVTEEQNDRAVIPSSQRGLYSRSLWYLKRDKAQESTQG